MTIIIRPEHPGEEQIINDLTVAAFAPMSYSDGSEAPIIAGLRKDGDLTISLVAVEGSDVVGHIAFSPVTIGTDNNGWYGLGPVSVWPDRQRKGIGSTLINEGLSILKARGAKGCALIGDPNYYRRFGFQSDGSLSYRELPAQYVQSLSFGDKIAFGQLRFSPAFER
jgi:putative acetyltransferase